MQFNSNIYDVNWEKITTWLLAPATRRQRMLALAKALTSPINDIHTRFGFYRVNVLYRLGITPQVCHLERALNDRYDVMDRRIYISDGVEMDALPLFLKAESKPVKLYKKSEAIHQVLYTKSETSIFSADFIVNIPITVPFDIAELIAFVNSYKLASKTFKVKLI